MSSNDLHCYISGLTPDIDWAFLKNEFSHFGEIRKIYLEQNHEFAKIYFVDEGITEDVVNILQQNQFGWEISLQDFNSQNKSFNPRSKMYNNYNDEFEVGNSTEKLYNVHGHYIESFDDGMGNIYVNLNDIRKTGFGIFTRQDFDIPIEAKRNIIIDDFYQYMLTQATNYILKNKGSSEHIGEEQILNAIQKCRVKLLGESHQTNKNLNQNVRRSDGNFQITVPNKQNTRDTSQGNSRDTFQGKRDGRNHRDKSQGKRDGRNDQEKSFNRNSTSNFNSFVEPTTSLRPPKNLPSNFTPTHTQRTTGPDRRTPRNTNAQGNNNERRGGQRQQQNFRSNSRNDESWDQDERNHKPTRSDHHNSSTDFGASRQSQFGQIKQSPNNTKNNFDTVSQVSDTSEKKRSFLKSIEDMEPMTKVELEIGKEYVVNVFQLEKEKNNVCWVQEVKSAEQLDDLQLEILEEIENLQIIEKPRRGQLALAEYEGLWSRCRVTGHSPLNVLFIDYGNRTDVDQVKILPVKFQEVPALANRLALHNNTIPLKEEMQLSVTIKRKYEDDTYLVEAKEVTESKTETVNVASKSQSVEEKQQSKVKPVEESKPAPVEEQPKSKAVEEQPKAKPVEEQPKAKPVAQQPNIIEEPKSAEESPKTEPVEKSFMIIPEPMTGLSNGDKVMLVGLMGNKMAVKTRESAAKSKEILEYIKGLNKSSLLLSHVKEDQLVLCSKDGIPNLCRAVIVKKDSPTIVTVRYLDFPGIENLSVKSLRNVDEHLAKEPLTLIFTPEMQVIEKLSSSSIDYIESLIDQKEKVIVVLTEDEDFDLKLKSGELLTQKLFNLEKEESKVKLIPVEISTPKNKPGETSQVKKEVTSTPQPKEVEPPHTPNANSKDKKIRFSDMDSIKPEIGSTDNYICFTIQDMSELTLISMNDESISYLEQISDLDIKDTTPYDPEIEEMCVISYKLPEENEASWYRGVVINAEDGDYNISMVDFGPSVMVKQKDIRKFPENLKAIPMLGIFCELVNIPDNEIVLKKIKELVPVNSEVEVLVKACNSGISYSIELPKIYKELKNLKLC